MYIYEYEYGQVKRIWTNEDNLEKMHCARYFFFMIKDARYIKDPKCYWAESPDFKVFDITLWET